jgi:hypothetical protein
MQDPGGYTKIYTIYSFTTKSITPPPRSGGEIGYGFSPPFGRGFFIGQGVYNTIRAVDFFAAAYYTKQESRNK